MNLGIVIIIIAIAIIIIIDQSINETEREGKIGILYLGGPCQVEHIQYLGRFFPTVKWIFCCLFDCLLSYSTYNLIQTIMVKTNWWSSTSDTVADQMLPTNLFSAELL